jgi:uncharacterized membrane protein YbhN (UPF0104 family)
VNPALKDSALKNPAIKKYLFLTLKIVIIVAVAVWVVWELYKAWGNMYRFPWKADYFYLVLSAIFYITAYLPGAWFWRYTMKSLGQNPGIYEALRAYYIGHLGKYVPGKAVVIIMRCGLLRNVRASIAAAAVFFETLTMMASGSLVSAITVAVFMRDVNDALYLFLISIAMFFVNGIPVFPPVFRYVIRKMGVGKGDTELEAKLNRFRLPVLLVGLLATSITFLFLGLSLWASVRGIGIDTGPLLEHLPRFVLAAAIALIMGFILMVPGGVGVREFFMAQVLTAYFVTLLMNGTSDIPAMSAEDAAKSAVALGIVVAGIQRIVSIVSELFISAVLFKGSNTSSTK